MPESSGASARGSSQQSWGEPFLTCLLCLTYRYPATMARTPQDGINRDARITVRFTPRETAKMDARRGTQARSSYIRALVRADTEENDG